MKTGLLYTAAVLWLTAGVGLFGLTNAALLTFSNPYAVRKSTQLPAVPEVVVFSNVNVVPMDGERILPGQTVVVQRGRITQISPASETVIPENALVIPGDGHYLLPGLIDAHVHIKHEDELLLFLAHGVTTVRDMWGTGGWQLALGFPNQLQLRGQIAEGVLLGPTLYTAGPIMEGEPAASPLMPVYTSPAAARESVAWQAVQGYDYVKVYDHLDTATYQAILDSAALHNLPVIGHAPAAIGLDAVLHGGQRTIEHLTGYIDPDAAAFRIPQEKLDEYAARTRESGVWNCPTLGIYTKIVSDAEVEQLNAMPGIEYISPRIRLLWPFFVRQLRAGLTYRGDDYPARIAAINTRMLQALHRAGAGIILGTDTDNSYLIPGLSALEELEALAAAGFTPYEALSAGTTNASTALGHTGEFGVIAAGSRADLLLLEANPLENVSHVRQRAGVMVRGRWFAEAELQTMLAEMAASYRPSWPDRLWPLALIAGAVVLVAQQLRKRTDTQRAESR